MHEIRVNAPVGTAKEIANLALSIGIDKVAVTHVYLHVPNRPADLISVDVSPKAKAFLDALFAHKAFDPQTWSITSSELRAIVGRSPVREITRPMVEPAIDV